MARINPAIQCWDEEMFRTRHLGPVSFINTGYARDKLARLPNFCRADAWSGFSQVPSSSDGVFLCRGIQEFKVGDPIVVAYKAAVELGHKLSLRPDGALASHESLQANTTALLPLRHASLEGEETAATELSTSCLESSTVVRSYTMQNEPQDLPNQGPEELLRRAQSCLARAELVTDSAAKAALLEMAAMLEGLAERAKAGERL